MAHPVVTGRCSNEFDYFRYWHETDMPTALSDVRSQGQSGKNLLALRFSGFDPTETSSLINV